MKAVQQSGIVAGGLFRDSKAKNGRTSSPVGLPNSIFYRNPARVSTLCTNRHSISARRRTPANVNCALNSQSFSEFEADSDGSDENRSNGPPLHFGGLLQPGSVRRDLIFLAFPAVLGQAIDPLAQLMETAYVGKLGALELASCGVGVSVFNIISKIFNVPLLSITTSFVAEDISRSTGQQLYSDEAGKEKLELPSISSALVLAAGIGAIEALALFLCSKLFLNMMGVSAESPMRSMAKLFLQLRALGAPANVLTLAVQGVFRGFKDTKTPLYYVGLGNLSAIILLPLLIYTFNFGVAGAAMATVASQYITMFMLLWSLSKRAVLLPPRMKDLQFGSYLKSGSLMLGRTLSILVTMTLGTSMAARQGPLAMAGHQICLQLWLAVSLLADSLAISSQAMIASYFALFDYKRVKEIADFSLQAGIFTGIALAVGLYTSFGTIAKLFTSDPEVLRIVSSCALFVCASQPINALAFIYDGLHYGVSDFSYAASATMVVGAISSAVLLYAPTKFGLAGVWAGLTLLMGLRMVSGIFRLQQRFGPWWFLHQKESKITCQFDQALSLEVKPFPEHLQEEPGGIGYGYVVRTD